ncbi:hypothetical protein [Myxococcus hansupus]|uniref:hypothetical protein n=1 Tax=Pseudomyxococcus hansupus TaxID=1297742 RepID=UPI0002E5DF56|nr:hypothetical protein [Myxococcus hansupus]
MARHHKKPSQNRLAHWDFGRAQRVIRVATGSLNWAGGSIAGSPRVSANRLNQDIPVLVAAAHAQVENDPEDLFGGDFDLAFASY